MSRIRRKYYIRSAFQNRKNMKKIYHLSSCSTCQRILQEIQAEKKGFVLQVVLAGRELFAGSEKKTVEGLKAAVR